MLLTTTTAAMKKYIFLVESILNINFFTFLSKTVTLLLHLIRKYMYKHPCLSRTGSLVTVRLLGVVGSQEGQVQEQVQVLPTLQTDVGLVQKKQIYPVQPDILARPDTELNLSGYRKNRKDRMPNNRNFM